MPLSRLPDGVTRQRYGIAAGLAARAAGSESLVDEQSRINPPCMTAIGWRVRPCSWIARQPWPRLIPITVIPGLTRARPAARGVQLRVRGGDPLSDGSRPYGDPEFGMGGRTVWYKGWSDPVAESPAGVRGTPAGYILVGGQRGHGRNCRVTRAGVGGRSCTAISRNNYGLFQITRARSGRLPWRCWHWRRHALL